MADDFKQNFTLKTPPSFHFNWKHEAFRGILLVFLVAVGFWDNLYRIQHILHVFAIIYSATYIANVVKKALFPSLNLRRHVDKSFESPVASSIVVLAICILLSSIIVSVLIFFKE